MKANLVGLALPEEVGGGGFGVLEVALVLEELGRHLAHVPLFASAVLGGMPLAAFGSEAQRRRWLVPAAGEGRVLGAAFVEAASTDPARPRTTARRDGLHFRLDGVKECVPAGLLAGLRSTLLEAAWRLSEGLHRFFLWSKHFDVTLGGAQRQLARLGALLVSEPRAGARP